MIKGEKKNRVAEQIPPPGFKLSKNDMAKKAVCLTIHQFVKTGDLCAGFFTLLKGGAPRRSGGRTAILSLLFCVQPARRGSAVWERRHSARPLQKLEKVA